MNKGYNILKMDYVLKVKYVYSASGPETVSPGSVKRPAKNCCSMLERGKYVLVCAVNLHKA